MPYDQALTSAIGESGKDMTVKLDKESIAAMQEARFVKVDDAIIDALEKWLQTYIPFIQAARDKALKDRVAKWHKTLNGERSGPAMRPDASNLSVPLTLWAAAAIRARIRLGVLEQGKVVSCTPLKSRTIDGVDLNRAATALARVIEADFENPRGLAGKQAIERCIKSSTDDGVVGFTLFEETVIPKYVMNRTGVMELRTARPQLRTEYIYGLDLLIEEGYGTDSQLAPLVGFEFNQTWHDMKVLEAGKHYFPNVLDKVAQFFSTPPTDMLVKHNHHRLAQFYIDYCLHEGEAPTSVLCTYHILAGKLLRVTNNRTPHGVRPVWLCNLDDNADPRMPWGQGVCSKLEGVQDETDQIHNLGIEAAKRATAHLIIVKAGSGAEAEMGASPAVLPGDTFATEVPEDDVKIVALGDPRGNEVALIQENSSRPYVTRILGLDESSVGDVQQGKRVPGGLGMSIQREGRVIVTNSIQTYANRLTEYFYTVIDHYLRRPPAELIAACLDREDAEALSQAFFTLGDTAARDAFVLSVSAQDAATSQEQKKMELMMVNQLLMGYFDKLIQYGQMAVMAPPQLGQALLLILTKMDAGVRALLNTVDAIQNPSEVLPDIMELAPLVAAAAQQVQQMQKAQMAAQGGVPPPQGAPHGPR